MIAGIPFIISVLTTLVLLLVSKKNTEYVSETNQLSKEQYPFKDIMPMGLLLADKVGIEKLKVKNKELYEKMISMYGIEVEFNFRLHMANKFMLSIIAIDAVYFIVLANGSINLFMIILGLIAGIATYFLSDSLQEEQFKKRTKEIKYDFPEFLTQLVLLINAGLTIERAWGKILEHIDKNTVLATEMTKTYNDMRSNKSISKCLNDLSRRCKVKEISKFTSIILQNINKGSSDMVFMLQQLSEECWVERKLAAKQRGEEASSKLLFPMMLMLLAVFAVVLVPAMMQMFAI
ncbi:type II secretion system F family protein [uncultured Clostridium sp.]|uniref:type II secretion system F family protein n=1 Tax=uncultured Clostridium sp. TaxID=59620 RepID=UPI0025DC6211|nr:type II secretion system F family protein [uncultured Clostridium sp.]